MAENITLKIFTPERTVFNKKVHRFILPYGKVNLTVIENRAPTSLIFEAGVLHILDENNEITDSYFIDGGVADIANDTCFISTSRFIGKSHISIDKALELKEKMPDNAKFYQMIAEYLEAFG